MKPSIEKRPSLYKLPSESSTNAMPQGTFTNGKGNTSTTESNMPRKPATRMAPQPTYLPSRGMQILSIRVDSVFRRKTSVAKSFLDRDCLAS